MKKYIFLLFLFYTSTVNSAGTYSWEINSYKMFNKGKLINTKLNEDGVVSLSLQFRKFAEIDTVFIWDIKEDSKGNIYLATGNEGIVYKVDTDGNVSRFFKTSSVAAFKILIDKKDNLYVSTLTKGLIYKIGSDGSGDIFTVFQEEYIWDMRFFKGNIILATGTPGSLYELNIENKEFKELVLTKEMHVTCMDILDNDIYFGTSDRGAVYKLTGSGDLKVIYQTSEKEIHSLVIDEKSGFLYAGTSDKEFGYVKYSSTGKISDPYKKQDESSKKMFDDYQEYKKIKIPANAVYKIRENEVVEKIIESKDSTFLSLLYHDEVLYIGSGDLGIIYSYADNKITKLAQLVEQQVLVLYKLKDNKILFSTGNIGNLYQFQLKYSNVGFYISEVLDARGWAYWGNIQWDSRVTENSEVYLQTRSGNTDDIDDTWSDWSDPYRNQEGALISSPGGRFIQFKINLLTGDTSESPELLSVKIPYLIKNRRPEVSSIQFLKKKNDSKVQSSSKSSSYKKYNLKAFELKIQWTVVDPDKDGILNSLYAKLRNGKEWYLIKDNLKEYNYTFDTRILPDGVFLFKVLSDDIPSNSLLTHLTDEKISKPFVVDNTPPRIEIDYEKDNNGNYRISGKITDILSSISSLTFSTDTKNWTSLFPVDKIFDTKIEDFQFDYKFDKGLIIIKAEDAAGNSSTSYLQINK